MKTRLRCILSVTAGLVLGCGAVEDELGLADAVALAASAGVLSHAVLTPEVPNEVTGLTALLYGCLAEQAAFGREQTPDILEVPPRVQGIYRGPPTVQAGELAGRGRPVEEVPAGGMVTLVGENFSSLRVHNLVTFDGQPVPISPLSSDSVISITIPFFNRDLPLDRELRVMVRGVPSESVKLRVLPPTKPTVAPFILGKRLLHKQYALARALREAEWPSINTAPFNDSPARRLVQCAGELEGGLKGFDTQLNKDARFLELYEMALEASPEIEQLLDRALERVAELQT